MNQVAEVREMEVCLDPTGRRFVAVFEDGSVSAWTGRQASEGCDSKDLHGEEFDLFYNEAGTLYPVTHGKIERQGYSENPDSIYYGSSPMIANGKIVGYVDHTDH